MRVRIEHDRDFSNMSLEWPLLSWTQAVLRCCGDVFLASDARINPVYLRPVMIPTHANRDEPS